MRFLAWILGGLLALAVLRMAAIVTFGAIVLALIVALIRAPKEMLAILTSMAFLGAFTAHPLSAVTLLAGVLICGRLLSR